MANIRFSRLLKDAMGIYGVGGTALEELLRENGVENISNKRISEYIRSVSTPSFEKARAIMDALGFPIKDDYLKASLEYNRELIRQEKEENISDRGEYAMLLNVHVRLRYISPDYSALENERHISERVFELYGDRNTARYVEELIAYDLKHNILGGEG